MAKFLILWEMDTTKLPESPEEQMALFTRLLDMVKEGFKSGSMTEWGEFVGGNAGYCIAEGTEQEIALAIMKYSPYVKFEVHPTLSVSQVEENMKALGEGCV